MIRTVGRTIRANAVNAPWATCAVNASATTPADRVLRKKLVRPFASLIEAERAPWSVKCSVDMMVSRSWRLAGGMCSIDRDLVATDIGS